MVDRKPCHTGFRVNSDEFQINFGTSRHLHFSIIILKTVNPYSYSIYKIRQMHVNVATIPGFHQVLMMADLLLQCEHRHHLSASNDPANMFDLANYQKNVVALKSLECVSTRKAQYSQHIFEKF